MYKNRKDGKSRNAKVNVFKLVYMGTYCKKSSYREL